jgi:hypothetical protein
VLALSFLIVAQAALLKIGLVLQRQVAFVFDDPNRAD